MAMAAAEASDHAAPSRVPLPATRQEVQAAVAKAVELRALHAALRQRAAPPNAGARASASRSPATIRLPPAASPARSRTTVTAAVDEDYPVFTPVSTASFSACCRDGLRLLGCSSRFKRRRWW